MIRLLDHHSRELDRYPDDLAKLLERRPRSDEAIKELDRLHRDRLRLLCGCGRILHVVQREFPFLRRNPGQFASGRECPLCESSGAHEAHSEGASLARCPNTGIGFILATRTHPEKREEDRGTDDRKSHGGIRDSLKYARGFSVLFTLMEGAGFTSLASTLPWKEMWGRIHRQLERIALHSGGDKRLSDFCWIPGFYYRGGLNGLNERLRNWDHPKIQPEGWVFAILPALPETEEVLISQIGWAMRRKSETKGENVRPPYRLMAPRHRMAVIGRSGPYLMLAAVSINDQGRSRYRIPHVHRLLLQAIAGEHNPIGVESDHERRVVWMLQKRNIAFVKPVFDSPEGLRPDFILPKNKMLIEVQGMTSDEYRERKREIHRRMIESQEYQDYRLIKFEANDGETISGFESRLLSAIRD